MLMSVYDSKGEMFEVRPDRAKALVIEQGWSLEAPSDPADMPLFTAVQPEAVAEAEAVPDTPHSL